MVAMVPSATPARDRSPYRPSKCHFCTAKYRRGQVERIPLISNRGLTLRRGTPHTEHFVRPNLLLGRPTSPQASQPSVQAPSPHRPHGGPSPGGTSDGRIAL